MNDFTISLAEIPIEIHPVCSETRSFFLDYLTAEQPVLHISVSDRDLEYELEAIEKKEGTDPSLPPLKKEQLEVPAVFRRIAERLSEYDTVLFHGCVVAVDGKAYLFTAPSGTGKTTHTMLWLKQLPQAYVLNGDKPFLKVKPDGKILACGVPWRGKEKYGRNEILPLAAICILERSPDNHIQEITPEEASDTLIRQIHLPQGPLNRLKTIQMLDRISREVKLYKLGCNMEPEAAQVSIRAMIPDAAERVPNS